jgi:hypothetical protein
MKKKLTKVISIICLLGCSIAVGATFTYAAYLNDEKYNQEIVVNTNFSSFFATGVGSATDPYTISTETQLQNLSFLTNLGVFTKETNFILGADFTCTSTLEPIGTLDCPFYSQFNGNGHIITDLHVVGTDVSDVGMFGYVAQGATIKNFTLSNVTVEGTGTLTSYQDPTTTINKNPLRSLITEDSASAISLSITSSSLTLSSSTITDSNSKTYTLLTKSSNTDVITDSGTIVTGTEYNGWITYEVYVEALVPINNEYRIVRYVIERYRFWCGTGTVTIDTADKKAPKKLIHTPNSQVNNVDKYYEKELSYIGIIAGHLDGDATYIGVYNGKILTTVKPFRSFSTLIGRRIDDSISDTTSSVSKESVDFEMVYENQSLAYTHSGKSGAATNITGNYGPEMYKNCYINNIYNSNLNGYFTANAERSIRFYGDCDVSGSTITPNEHGLGLSTLNYRSSDEATDVSHTGNFLTLDNFMEGRLDNDSDIVGTWLFFTVTYNEVGKRDLTAKNSICMNLTQSTIDSIWGQITSLFGKSGDFYINFDFDYIYYDESGTNTSNSMHMLGTRKRETISSTGVNINGTSDNDFDYYDDVTVNYDSLGGGPMDPLATLADGVTTIPDNYYTYGNVVSTNNTDPLSLTDSVITSSPTSANTYTLQHKTISIRANAGYFNWGSVVGKRTPLFLLGVSGSETLGNWKLYFKNFDITFTDRLGNYAGDDTYHLDYLYDTNATYDNGTDAWTNWNDSSNTKVYFSHIDTSLPDGAGKPFMDQYTSYQLDMARTQSSGVTCGYTVHYGTTDPTEKNIIPYNTGGYKSATISSTSYGA